MGLIVILEQVTTADLSSNQFSGNIPPDIANCAYLNVLNLDNNNLEGEIPSRIGSLPRLMVFNDVADNNLTGPLPSFVSVQITADSFANNPGLCGKPLKECDDSEDSWIWEHIDHASFIEAFVVGWVLFFTLFLVLRLFKFPTKAINMIFSLNVWKLRSKEHLSPRSDSPGGRGIKQPPEDFSFDISLIAFKFLFQDADLCENPHRQDNHPRGGKLRHNRQR
ncbi:hypothetical protein K7X08_005457 [Anisodus acutangulus]|uniref:Uncharacterized protein n=1 Tax=Anisodus acutangulus TaxID=402998 RepID=A0A9Q1LTG9_9SOLA|nr:hypothetical protein K7X08_005457 [Anisodus acutangulus]